MIDHSPPPGTFETVHNISKLIDAVDLIRIFTHQPNLRIFMHPDDAGPLDSIIGVTIQRTPLVTRRGEAYIVDIDKLDTIGRKIDFGEDA